MKMKFISVVYGKINYYEQELWSICARYETKRKSYLIKNGFSIYKFIILKKNKKTTNSKDNNLLGNILVLLLCHLMFRSLRTKFCVALDFKKTTLNIN